MDDWSRWQTSLIVSRNIKVLMISEHPIGKKNQTAFECISEKKHDCSLNRGLHFEHTGPVASTIPVRIMKRSGTHNQPKSEFDNGSLVYQCF